MTHSTNIMSERRPSRVMVCCWRLISVILCILLVAHLNPPAYAVSTNVAATADDMTGVTTTVSMPEAYTQEEMLMAALLISGSTDKTVLCRDMSYEEAGTLHRNLQNILLCVPVGESHQGSGQITYSKKSPTDANGRHRVMRYTSRFELSGLYGLEQDPRVIAELEKINTLSSWEEKVMEIASWTASLAVYDKEAAAEAEKTGTLAKDHPSTLAIGVLNGKAVCQGYANLADYLYDQTGIESVKVVCSYVIDSSIRTHIVNSVKAPDGTVYITDSCNFNSFETKLFTVDGYAQAVGHQFRYKVNINCLYGVASIVDQLVAATEAEDLY